MCLRHWCRLPGPIRQRVNDAYRPGQTLGTASPEYADAVCGALAYAFAAEAAGRGEPVPASLAELPAPCPDGCGHPLTLHSAVLGCWLCACAYGRGGES